MAHAAPRSPLTEFGAISASAPPLDVVTGCHPNERQDIGAEELLRHSRSLLIQPARDRNPFWLITHNDPQQNQDATYPHSSVTGRSSMLWRITHTHPTSGFKDTPRKCAQSLAGTVSLFLCLTIGGTGGEPSRIIPPSRECEPSKARTLGRLDLLLTGHELFDRIGRDPAERQKEYWALFRTALDPGFVDGLRAATNGGWALGDTRFKRQIAKALGRRVAPLARGWPPKAKAERR
jgi:hypothetical protein